MMNPSRRFRDTEEQVDIPLEPLEQPKEKKKSKKGRKKAPDDNGDLPHAEPTEIPLKGEVKWALTQAHLVLSSLRQRIPPETFLHAKGIAILSATRGGFLFTGGSSNAVVISRQEDNHWGFPCPVAYSDIAVGPVAGWSSASIVVLISDEEFLNKFYSGEKYQLKKGFHRMFARPNGTVQCRQVRPGMRYLWRSGLLAGAGFRFMSIRMGNLPSFYGKVHM